MLYDFRKMLAMVGERLGVGGAVLWLKLNHTTPKADVLHQLYVVLGFGGVLEQSAYMTHEVPSGPLQSGHCGMRGDL
jgi:hypothetical protein